VRATIATTQMVTHQWIFVYHGWICWREENRTEFNCMQQ